MAKQGDVIENPIFGDRVVFHKTAADTGGQVLEGVLYAKPGALGPPEHVHPYQEERFTVIAGALTGRIGGREITAGPGEHFVVPPGTPHTWANAGPTEVQVRIEVRPAGRMDSYLETLYGLAKDGKTNAKGLPNPLQLAVIATTYFDTIYLATPPLLVQRIVFGPLAFVGRLAGYRPDYPYPYSTSR